MEYNVEWQIPTSQRGSVHITRSSVYIQHGKGQNTLLGTIMISTKSWKIYE